MDIAMALSLLGTILTRVIIPVGILLPAAVQAAVPVSVKSYSAYLEQPECVKNCLWQGGAADDLVWYVGCSEPFVNECYCRPEQAGTASRFLSECATASCGQAGPALTSAISVYRGYCSGAGFSIPTVATIISMPAFQSQIDCVQMCIWHAGQTVDDLMPAMSCGEPWDNDCLCDAARMKTVGNDFLSTCVASRCSTATTAPLVTSALSVHSAYCSSAGLPLPAPAVSATSSATKTASSTATGSGTRPDDGEPPGPGQTSGPDEGPGGEPSESGSGLSTGAIIGIALGAAALAIAIVSAAVILALHKRRSRQSAENISDETGFQATELAAAERPQEKWSQHVFIEADGHQRSELGGVESHASPVELSASPRHY